MKRERLHLIPRFEPEPEPEPEPKRTMPAPGHTFIVTGLAVVVTRTGERRELNHLAWPRYFEEVPFERR